MKKILVLEDESNIRSFIVINLKRNGYDPIEASSGEQALERLKVNPDIALALLDVMLPGIDGFEVCRKIRASGSKMGIIMLTAKSQEIDKVTGLMTGADDYVTKPFSPAELTARVDALIRRLGGDEPAEEVYELQSGPFTLNTRNRTLDREGKRLKLTQIEYLLMKLFMENPGKAMSRSDILTAVWGADFEGELKTVDVNIRRLRMKIESDPTEPEFLTTVWGYGYKWGY
ncbi:MAG: response regulator transcription factor [Oscillospiraceae bacterium]|nr:response regulator transcription factor [Oscillospiraceae bacterium]